MNTTRSISACVTQALNSTLITTSISNSSLRVVHYVIIGSSSFVALLIIMVAVFCVRKQLVKSKSIKQKGLKKHSSVSCRDSTTPHYEDIGHAVEIDYEKLVNEDIQYESMIDLRVFEVPDIKVLKDEHPPVYTINNHKKPEGLKNVLS
ncbi:uncharacterized protein LOC105843284 [Hydra vulgaris]|uniref:uncharacterized protein LOC105843284 n=1 Tax=Hydra vulgaris TaxID=6087 RepID=UPI001F5E87CF|nr:uncharacterized protein LOC105843284 [Hydra vulgaris]